MVTALILFTTERNNVNNVAEKLAAIDGISEVYSVSGRYDLVAMIRVKSNDDVARLVTDELTKLEGILSTETLLAFRAYSRHDLDSIFSIGFEE